LIRRLPLRNCFRRLSFGMPTRCRRATRKGPTEEVAPRLRVQPTPPGQPKEDVLRLNATRRRLHTNLLGLHTGSDRMHATPRESQNSAQRLYKDDNAS
jgi:hypothetical protein